MKKDFAVQQMGGVKQLADLLGIVRQAIYQWDEDVPKLRAYQLCELRPDLFSPGGEVALCAEIDRCSEMSNDMNELIKVGKTVIGEETIQTVNARELHDFLGSKQDFSTWIKGRIKQYDFEEGIDYTLHKIVERENQGLTTKIDYFIAIDMAKELSMVERTPKGKEARRYFIECEKRLLQYQMNALTVEQERRITVLEAKMEDTVKRYDAKIAGFEEGSRFYTVFAYAYHRGITEHLSISEARQLNKRASVLSKELGCFIDKVRDPRWGLINAYHQDVLEAVFEELLSA